MYVTSESIQMSLNFPQFHESIENFKFWLCFSGVSYLWAIHWKISEQNLLSLSPTLRAGSRLRALRGVQTHISSNLEMAVVWTDVITH